MGAFPAAFHDLVRALEDHPEWRAELRRLVLTDELLALPDLVRDLATAQRRTEERLDHLATIVQSLGEAQRRTEARLEELAAAQRRTEEGLALLTHKVAALSTRVSTLHGDAVERRYRQRAHACFANILRRIRVLSSQELADLLDDAFEAGQLTWEERGALLQADLVAEGCTPQKERAFLLAEVSVTVSQRDVDRARQRADLLARITGVPAWPVVAGEELVEGIRAYARSAGVWQVLDGHVLSPHQD